MNILTFVLGILVAIVIIQIVVMVIIMLKIKKIPKIERHIELSEASLSNSIYKLETDMTTNIGHVYRDIEKEIDKASATLKSYTDSRFDKISVTREIK